MSENWAFHGAKSKIERAEKHIFELKAALMFFFAGNPYTTVFRTDPQSGEMTIEVRLKSPIPADIALIIGDVVHNLRTALDHATWELIGRDGGTQDRWTSLPTGKDKTSYESSCKGVKSPRADTKEFFIALECYKGGRRNDIYGLGLLDNADKHTVLTPLVGAASVPRMRILNPDGSLAATITDSKFSMGSDGRARVASLGRGLAAEFDHKTKPTLDVFFSNVEVFEFQPVIETLMHLRNAVSHCVGEFETFVRTRTP